MSDVGANLFAERGVVPEYVVPLSVFSLEYRTLHFIRAPGLGLSSILRQFAMEKFNINYSTKNIPLPSRSDYLERLIDKTEQFLRRMRWKAHFFLNPDTTSSSKETYGFKSSKNPPPVEELKDFEDDMLKMIQSVKFKQVNNPFLNKLTEDTDRIKNEPKLLIAADKTTNFYKLRFTGPIYSQAHGFYSTRS